MSEIHILANLRFNTCYQGLAVYSLGWWLSKHCCICSAVRGSDEEHMQLSVLFKLSVGLHSSVCQFYSITL